MLIAQIVLFFLFRRSNSDDNPKIEDKTKDIVKRGIDVDDGKEENKDSEYISDYI